MKKILSVAFAAFLCGFLSLTASAQQPKLDKLIGKWSLKAEYNGQIYEATGNVTRDDDGVYGIVDYNGEKSEKIYIKEINGRLSSDIDIPEYNAQVSVVYSFVDDDTVNLLLDAGGMIMETTMTRIK